jgi:hypothetical protein
MMLLQTTFGFERYDDSGLMAFQKYHRDNPHIFAGIVSLGLTAKRRGRSRWGVMAILNVLRWKLEVEARDEHSPWKINNNYAPHYARLVMSQEPELQGFFNLRSSRADYEENNG